MSASDTGAALPRQRIDILPALIPLIFVALHIFVSVVQTYVFTVLPSVYIGMAASDHH